MAIAMGMFPRSGWPARRFLVCDDERHVARLIQVNLEQQGHSVVCVFDGRQAIQMLKASLDEGALRFDCAVLELKVPYMDGFGILKWIRCNPETVEMWVVLMTARAEDFRGFDQYPYLPDKVIAKPFNPLELLAEWA